MTLEQVMNLTWDQINSMNVKDLKAVTKIVGDVANKRIKRLEKSDYIATNALNAVRDGGGGFSIKGKNINQLRGELNRARQFINAKTSTVSGAKKVYQAREKALYGTPSKTREQAIQRAKQSSKVEEVYGKFLQLNPTSKNTLGSDTVRAAVAEIVEDNPDMSVDELLEMTSDRYMELYEETVGDEYEWDEGDEDDI